MSDRWVVLLAASAWVGALLARPLPLVVAAIAVAGAAALRQPLPWCVALLLVTDVLAVRALDGLEPPPASDFAGTVTLVTDPELDAYGRMRVEVAAPQGRLLAETRAPAAQRALVGALAGDRVSVEGSVAPLSRPSAWTRSRHLAGALRIDSVSSVAAGAIHTEAANAYRRLLERGTETLSPAHRSLLVGLVLGDDRAQPPQLTADFRASGLTHLLAVSGQNVAFVLVVAGPFLRRFRLWPRMLVALAVIAAFALVTRFEPSVVRAAFVAGVALFARTTGRPSGGVRHLGLAVCLLLVVDPLLVHALGFRLSVAAALGVLVIAPRLVERLPGPRWLRTGLGVTAGAQLAVAPVLVPTLGPMPLGSLPANVVAGPIAAAMMVWGLTAGTLAGAVGEPLAGMLHLPSTLGLAALERVAAVGASLPLGRVELRHLGVAVGAIGAAVLLPRVRVAAAAVLAVVALAPALTAPALGAREVGRDAIVWVDGPVAVVVTGGGASAVEVVETLRSSRVAAVGLVVARSGDPSAAAVVEAIGARFPVGAVVGPPGLDVPDLVSPPGGFRVRVGRIGVVVDEAGPPLRVRVGWAEAEGG